MRLAAERGVDFVQGDCRSGVLQWGTEAGLNCAQGKVGPVGVRDGNFQEEASGEGVCVRLT